MDAKPEFDHWGYIKHVTGIDVKTVDDADRAFGEDMNQGSFVDGHYQRYKNTNPDRIFYDDLTPAQKGKFLVSGLYWDRIGRIGTVGELMTSEKVIAMLGSE